MCYTIGAVVYGRKRPDPSPAWFGFHEIFHACTIAGLRLPLHRDLAGHLRRHLAVSLLALMLTPALARLTLGSEGPRCSAKVKVAGSGELRSLARAGPQDQRPEVTGSWHTKCRQT